MVMRAGLLALLLLLAPGAAWADAFSSTPPAVWAGPLANLSQQTANRTSWLTHKPFGNGMLQNAATSFDRTSGQPCSLTAELEDNYTAVQFAFASDTAASAYTIQQAVTSSSAMYGPNNRPGILAYDYAGNSQLGFFPVTFNNNGAPSDGFSGIPQRRDGDATSGVGISYVTVVSGGASGASTATIAIPAATTIQGNFRLQNGMFVSDGIGTAIPSKTSFPANSADTTFTLSGNTMTFSNPLTASLAVNQVLYISYAALKFSVNVPGSTNPVQPQWVYSDPIPLQGLYRTDGGVQAGDAVNGPGVQAGTVVPVGGVTPTSISLSLQLTATTGGQPAVNFTRAGTTSQIIPATWSYFVPLSTSTANLTPGMHVQDAANDFPAYTVILAVLPNGVRTNAAPTVAVAAGTAITFTHVMYPIALSNGLTSGSSTILFPSTNAKPLLTVRVAATGAGGTGTVSSYNQATPGTLQEQAWGMPLNSTYRAGSIGLDVINNNFQAVNMNATSACPVYFMRYQTLHRGIDMPMAGDSQTAGNSTVTASYNFGRIAANQISKPTLPIETPNFGISGQWGNDFQTALSQYVYDTKPPIIYMQGMTRNSIRDSPTMFYAQLMGIANRVMNYGGKVIVGTQMPWGGLFPGDYVVASDVNNSTTVPLLNSASNALTTVAGYGIGLPLGTATFSMTHFAMTMTASTPITVPANTVIHSNQMVVASQVTAATAIPITSQFPIINANCIITWPGGSVAETTTLPGATTVTVGSNVTIAPGTVLTLTCTDNLPTDRQQWISIEKGLQADNDNSMTFFDLYASMEDPANPGFWNPAYTSDDVHANDIGQPVAAGAFLPVLQRAIGK